MTVETEKSPGRGAIKFRGDLVGFRALAVLAVLLHHFQIPGFEGAFYGPDIFFVLSGYLITGSLVREYARNTRNGEARGSISFIGLYLRRVRRIIPAATFVLIVINVYAHFYVNELKARSIYIDSIWTFFFGANIRFSREATDYFAINRVSPLVHFWSLSVTEQFYLVWPALLLVAARVRIPGFSNRPDAWRKQMVFALSVLIVASFIWCVIVFRQNENVAYFSTFCRAWELAVGGAIGILSFSAVDGKKRLGFAALRIISLVFLFGSILFVKQSNFGYTIWIPVVACAFLIFTGKHFDGDLSSRLLGSKPLYALGTISYSVYLWHWPIFVFAQERGLMDTLFNRFIGIFATIIVGAITYRYIEQTFMSIKLPSEEKYADKNLTSKQRVLKRAIVATCLAIVLAVPANALLKPTIMSRVDAQPQTNGGSKNVNEEFLNDYGVPAPDLSFAQFQDSIRESLKLTNLPDQVSPQLKLLENNQNWRGNGFDCMEISKYKKNAGTCAKGARQSNQSAKAPKVVILGSSVSGALIPAVAGAFDPKVYNLRGYIWPACSIADVPNITKTGIINPRCDEFRKWSFSEINKLHPEYVVISTQDHFIKKTSDTDFRARLTKSLKTLSAPGTKVIFVGAVPSTPNLLNCITGRTGLGEDCFTPSSSDAKRRIAQKQAIESVGGTYIDPVPWICVDGGCPPVINNMIVSWDGTHFTTWFSKYVGRYFKQELERRQLIK